LEKVDLITSTINKDQEELRREEDKKIIQIGLFFYLVFFPRINTISIIFFKSNYHGTRNTQTPPT